MSPETLAAIQTLGEALLIGLLIGAQRSSDDRTPGLRDFLLIALAGSVCGLLGEPWLTAAALVSITGIVLLFRFHQRDEVRGGVTTDLAAVATFCLTYLVAIPKFPAAAAVAIGAAITVVAFLEFKRRLHEFFRETLTEEEFNASLVFLAVVLVIYPLLPPGRYGPYEFFAPREVWFFVILVSSISYVGYFLRKFLGEKKGLDYTAVVGGLASSLATTLDLARRSRKEPERSAAYARAAGIANTVQFPRTIVAMLAISPPIAMLAIVPLLAAFATGAALTWVLARTAGHLDEQAAQSQNPFRVRPALTFGALFALIVLLNRAANAEFGQGALAVTSALGGLVDVAAVVLTGYRLVDNYSITLRAAADLALIALAANILAKAVLALVTGSSAFAARLTGALLLMLGAGAAARFLLPF